MITLLFFLMLSGFFLFYNTSKRAVLNRSFLLENLAQDNPVISRAAGAFLLLAALAGSMLYWGFSAGIFAFLIVLMTVGSLVILLAPLRYLSYTWIAFFFLLSLTAELIFC